MHQTDLVGVFAKLCISIPSVNVTEVHIRSLLVVLDDTISMMQPKNSMHYHFNTASRSGITC